MVTKRLTVFWLECLNITIFLIIVFGFSLFYVIGSTLTKYGITDHYLTSLAHIPGVNTSHWVLMVPGLPLSRAGGTEDAQKDEIPVLPL